MAQGRRFGRPNARYRDTQITVRNLDESQIVDGFYVDTQTRDIIFMARVMDKGEVGSVLGDKRLTAESLVLEVDRYSVEDVNENDTLTTDKDSIEYEVVDKFDMSWKFTSVLVCQAKGSQ